MNGGIFATDGLFWRRLAHAGASRGPEWLRRYSPPLFGLAFAAALPDARRAIAANLRRIRGRASATRDAIDVARTFSAYASCLAEALAGEAHGTPAAVIYGERNLDAAFAKRRGAIFVTAHTGGWEVVGPLLMRDHHVSVVMVMSRERVAAARELNDAAREERGLRVVHVGGDPLASLPLLRQLREGGVVALQVDRVPEGSRSRDVRLFGARASVPEGPLRLAQVSGAPIVPVFAARTGYRRYLVRAYEPIDVPRRADDLEIDRAAQRTADAMGSFLAGFPTQWFHFQSERE